MRIQYDPEADVLLIVLRDAPPVDALEEPGGESSLVTVRTGNRSVSSSFVPRPED